MKVALEVDGGRGRHVLQVGLGQAAIAAATQPEGAHPLREGALDPGPPGIAAAPSFVASRSRAALSASCSARVHSGRAVQAAQSVLRNQTEM